MRNSGMRLVCAYSLTKKLMYVLVVEGTRDVSTICAELMVKLHRSLVFSDVTWIPRAESDAVVGVESERSKALMRCVGRYEFDAQLRKRLAAAAPTHLFILSNLYDVGFWRRATEAGVVPAVVWYVESGKPTEDPKRASFVRFARGLGLKDVRFVRSEGDDDDGMTVLNMISAALDLIDLPDVAAV